MARLAPASPLQQRASTRDLGDEDQLRLETFEHLCLGLGLTTLLLRWWLASQYGDSLVLWLALTGALAVLWFSVWAGRRSPAVGSVLATVLVLAESALLAHLRPALAASLVLPPLFALSLLGLPALLAAAALSGTTAYALLGPGPGRDDVLVAIALVSAFGWLGQRPLRARLDWAWNTSLSSLKLAERLREQKGRLGVAVKSLDLSNQLLQRTNYELALAEQEANDVRLSKEQFAAAISHELRTPLNIILGFSDIMYHSPEVYGDFAWPPTLRRDVAEIYRNARHLADFTNDIMDLAESDKPRMLLRRELTGLAGIIEEAADVARALAHDKPIDLQLDIQPALPRLFVDRMRIRQVLLNLLSNAIRFTGKGQVTVRAFTAGNTVEITVADTGPGIPPEELEAIFDEFYQVVSQQRDPGKGKGLGLAIAKHLVLSHGGRIWAESQVGQGSTFHVSLPLERKDVSRLVRSPAPLPANRRHDRRVLLVDSDAQTAAMVCERLEDWRLSQAISEEAAMAMVGELQPDSLLVNEATTSPGLAVSLAATFPSVPVIGFRLPGAATSARPGLVQATLYKPVDAQQLLPLLSGLLPNGGNVLLADDDRGFAQLLARMLATTDHQFCLRCAYSGADALRRAEEHPPDAFVLDLLLPDMDGLALAQALRAQPANATKPVVLVTGARRTRRHHPPSPGADGTPEDEHTPDGNATALHIHKNSGLAQDEFWPALLAAVTCVRATYSRSSRQRPRQDRNSG